MRMQFNPTTHQWESKPELDSAPTGYVPNFYPLPKGHLATLFGSVADATPEQATEPYNVPKVTGYQEYADD